MKVLVTGAAGFIGFNTARALLDRGDHVVGLDNLNDYYDVRLKEMRLERLSTKPGFTFVRADISDRDAFTNAVSDPDAVTGVVHLAAQAGVRYSLENPYAYIESNVMGHLVVLEFCRSLRNFRHLVYASSSSVYGGCKEIPFSVDARVDTPISLYAATKKADELMGHAYAHLFRLPATGLRFFTVYGPWGRPDMAAYLFARAIFDRKPIKLFNNGDMLRDFTFIDDLAPAVVSVLDGPPTDDGENAPHRVYNIGNNRCEKLTRYVELIEEAIGIKAEIDYLPMQPGDVRETWADISAIQRDHGFEPKTPIDVGIPKFIEWFRTFHNC